MDDNSDGIIDREIEPTILISPPYDPDKPSGPLYGEIFQDLSFSTSTVDPDRDQIYYMFDWDDGTNSSWLGPYESGEIVNATHTWNEDGIYDIKVKAKDSYNVTSGWSEPLTVYITKKTMMLGLISNVNKSAELSSFNAVWVIWLRFKPFDLKIYSSGEQIMISNDYSDYLGQKGIIGRFNAMVLSESSTSSVHPLRNRLKHLIAPQP
jgi:hypothetical protein